ncbi:MAG: hypothetical protein GWN01_14755, partial [Nitrosopumilaceae archaeon]|nr:hypothetical protein [Nitrosopumilaceae archaeon]NIU86482.1 hypothetical protein [Nitrosopumilaceae archaeon]NIV66185.1 hypothetical protein [Nitrosopumilaceae archaeon]NIX62711.1 hypothetical protein [Nitrosopumilaceae archaeon]
QNERNRLVDENSKLTGRLNQVYHEEEMAQERADQKRVLAEEEVKHMV